MADGMTMVRAGPAQPQFHLATFPRDCGHCDRLGDMDCGLRQRSILIAEPATAMGQGLSAILAEGGIQSRVVSTGVEAVGLDRGRDFFDLLVTELHGLGAQGGLEVIRLLRHRRPWLPVVVLADQDAQALLAQIARPHEGPTEVLTKPVLPATLLGLIGRMLVPRCDQAG